MMDEAAVVAAFLARAHDDRCAGREVPLETYLAAFPGFETVIAREFAGIRAGLERHGAAFGSTAALPRPATLPEGAPSHVGRYRLLEEVARGGQGEVYLAEDLQLPRKVALKLLRGIGPASEPHLRRFRREA